MSYESHMTARPDKLATTEEIHHAVLTTYDLDGWHILSKMGNVTVYVYFLWYVKNVKV